MTGDLNLLITGGCGFIGSNFINYYFPKQNINKLVNLDAMYYNASENNVDLSIKQNFSLHELNFSLNTSNESLHKSNELHKTLRIDQLYFHNI